MGISCPCRQCVRGDFGSEKPQPVSSALSQRRLWQRLKEARQGCYPYYELCKTRSGLRGYQKGSGISSRWIPYRAPSRVRYDASKISFHSATDSSQIGFLSCPLSRTVIVSYSTKAKMDRLSRSSRISRVMAPLSTKL